MSAVTTKGLELSCIRAGYGIIASSSDRDPSLVLDDVSFNLSPGKILGLVGLNGSGKSTLIRVVSGHLAPSRGWVRWEGVELKAGEPWSRLKNGVVLLSQDRPIFGQLSIRDNLRIAAGAAPRRKSIEEAIAIAKEPWCEWIEERLNEKAWVLSAGEYRLLALAMVFICEPRLLLLDEPLASLDGGRCEALSEHVGKWLSEGSRCVLIAEQDLHGLANLGGDVLLLSRGKIARKWNSGSWEVSEVADAMAAVALC